MIYNEKRFSDIAFSKHIVTADSCSSCGKEVLHQLLKQKNNYNEFVFGIEYRQMIKSFLSGIDYHNKILCIKNKVHSSSVSYIHNKHNDSFAVTYYNPSRTLEDIIDNCNFVLLDIFKKYNTEQRRKIVDSIFTHFISVLDKEQKNNIIRCISLDDYNINKSYSPMNIDKRNLKSDNIDFSQCQNILNDDIQSIIKKHTRFNKIIMERYKLRVKLFLHQSFIEWIQDNTRQFPDVVCNSCKGKKIVTAKFKDKFDKSMETFQKRTFPLI